MEDLLAELNSIDALVGAEEGGFYLGEDLVECPIWFFRGLCRYSYPLYFLIMRDKRVIVMRMGDSEESPISLGEIWDILPEETRGGLIYHLDLFRG